MAAFEAGGWCDAAVGVEDGDDGAVEEGGAVCAEGGDDRCEKLGRGG